MLISPIDINKILSMTSSVISARGKKYFEKSRVKPVSFFYVGDDKFVTLSEVRGTNIYQVKVEKNNGKISYECDCPHAQKNQDICKHVIATLFQLYINPETYQEVKDFMKKKKVVKLDSVVDFSSSVNLLEDRQKEQTKPLVEYIREERVTKENAQLISYYENIESEGNVKTGLGIQLVPRLQVMGYPTQNLLVDFRIGNNRFYVIKDIYRFAENVENQEEFAYGKNLKFVHKVENFHENSRELLNLIRQFWNNMNYLKAISKYNIEISNTYKSSIVLGGKILDDFFMIMQNKEIDISFAKDYQLIEKKVKLVEEDPKLSFQVVDNESVGLNMIYLSKEKYCIYRGHDAIYLLGEDKLYKCSSGFKKNIYPLLNKFLRNHTDCIKIEGKYATSFCEYLIPQIMKKAKVEIDEKIIEKYKSQKLGTKVYLDIDEHSNIVADIKFCYLNFEFNPFESHQKIYINRNKEAEEKVYKLLNQYHFLVDTQKGNLLLQEEEDIYYFLTEGINIFMQKFEVLVTDKFKFKKMIHNDTFQIGVKIENDLIKMEMEHLNFSEKELKELLKSYQLKRKYHRLKDGSFLLLENSGIGTLSKMQKDLGISEKDIVSSKFSLPKYRAVYLDHLIAQDHHVNWEKDVSFKEMMKDMKQIEDISFVLPTKLNASLRPYQLTGYDWLKVLAKYQFGGILADDMGLGKTLQIIAVLQSIKEEEKSLKKKEKAFQHKPSIIVCPSSLYINWEKEINRFAPELKIKIIAGNAMQRESSIQKISNVDVVITSYDLLKRDIEYYKNCEFQFAIADEAQYIKNNNTQNAKALKKIKAVTRFALTGTPIENSLSELWSIFDFVMPGYLFSYAKFKEHYETPITRDQDSEVTKRLQKLVDPFILRRVKKEVLKELPEKTESIMYSQMNEKQKKLYQSILLKTREEIEEAFDEKGFEKSRIKVLAAITRLRQICCHPSLFIENYDGHSSKLEQCLQIIEDAIASNHKILLFSGFTSMFDIIITELKKRNIAYDILTGSTKVDTRIQMVEDFNQSEEKKIFLISLKAGGTGLNLTGADIVIHFDPWWNLSAQNQATDRAYRIGQRNNVQVFKLITQDSIEEKILKLQEKKVDLTNAIISENETFINKMSKEEILELFNM